MNTEIQGALFAAASEAQQGAHAPYSKFPVGAALLSESGSIFSGCNVENAVYSECVCAEACAIGAMVAAGDRHIVQICIVCKSGAWAPPCGGCRQKIREFGTADTQIIVSNADGKQKHYTLGELLPNAFGPDNLEMST